MCACKLCLFFNEKRVNLSPRQFTFFKRSCSFVFLGATMVNDKIALKCIHAWAIVIIYALSSKIEMTYYTVLEF